MYLLKTVFRVNIIKLNIIFIIFFFIVSCSKDIVEFIPEKSNLGSSLPLNVVKTNSTTVLMHYMPWFETNESNNGSWGIHWTMASADPNLLNPLTGNREIASFFYPLIGPYHSGDPAVIEYHLLLMKYSGVDAVVIDWYGIKDIYDYKINFDNSDKFIKKTSEIGLDFGIVYEPYTTSIIEKELGLNKSVVAIEDLIFLKKNYFYLSNYLKINGQTSLLIFGNNFSGDEWNTIFKNSDVFPMTYFLQFLTKTDNLFDIIPTPGEFFWVNQSDTLGQYYWRKNFNGSKIGAAYPGFKDYYYQGGWIKNHLNWSIDVNLKTLKDRLMAIKSMDSKLVQIQTFNDFGEGTMMEPTFEFGFSFLNELQVFTGVPYSEKELELIYKYYLLRTKFKSLLSDSESKKIFDLLNNLKVKEAELLINYYIN
uniref:hypothetical protein n=1 Tax=Algoriphagus sp. TaxID=1872435 RepID=UPI0040473407